MTERTRVLIAVLAATLLAGVAVTYAVRAAGNARSAPVADRAADAVRLDRPGQLFYRDAAGRVAAASLRGDSATLRGDSATLRGDSAGAVGGSAVPPKPRMAGTSLECARFYAARGTGVCLTPAGGLLRRSDAVILDATLREVRRIPLAGTPNRARVSPSGRMVSWTVFVSGESYARSGFSTWTSILDTHTGEYLANIESIALYRDGVRYYSPDVNYWGVTFTDDDDRFYATVGSKGKTHLVEGSLADWEARTLRENVECPSLSPDNTRLAFKKRVSGDPRKANPWRLHVLELRTGRETALAENAGVDDQAAWLDNETIAYARLGSARGSTDIWTVRADGSGRPRLLIPRAMSPAQT